MCSNIKINQLKFVIDMKTMKLWRIALMMLAAFYLASCKPSARQTTADAEQPTDSTEAVTSADTMFGHHRQTPLANRLPYTEDTETSIGFYYSRNS